MIWEIYFVFALLIFAIVSFVWERVSADLTSLTVFGLLLFVSMLSGSTLLPTMEETLGVFSNSAPLTIAAMFIVSSALERTGAIDLITGYLRKLVRLPYRGFIFVMVVGVAAASAFVNNTPVVIVLMPVMLSLSREIGVASSKLLIPLSYASILEELARFSGPAPTYSRVASWSMPVMPRLECSSSLRWLTHSCCRIELSRPFW